jgi:hypothetical protein
VQGDPGPQGPSGVVEVLAFQGAVGDVVGPFSGFRFIGDTVNVTVADGQRITGSATAVLGIATAIGIFVDFDLCYRETPSGTIQTFSANPLRAFLRILGTPYTANASRVFSTGGVYEVGYCIDPSLLGAGNEDELTGTDSQNVAGWLMVTNEP